MAQSVHSSVQCSSLIERALVVEGASRQGLSFPSSAEGVPCRRSSKANACDKRSLALNNQCRVSLHDGSCRRRERKRAAFHVETPNTSSLNVSLAAGVSDHVQSSPYHAKETVAQQLPDGSDIAELAGSGDEDGADAGNTCPSLLAWFDKMSKNKLGYGLPLEETLRRQRVQEQPFRSRRHFTMSMPALALSWSLLPSMQQMAVSLPTTPALSPPSAEVPLVSAWRPVRDIIEGPTMAWGPGEVWVEWDWLLHGPVASAAVDEERVAFDEEKLLEQNRRIQALNNAPADFPGFIRKKFEVKVVATDNYISTRSGLLYLDIDQGSGVLPVDGQEVVFHYTGYNESGRRVDSSYMQGQPARTRVGIKGMIPGFEEGIKSMKVGGKRRIVVPPELGPPTGPGTFFSAKQYEVFDVELIAVRNCERRTIAFFSDVQCSDI
eukprot:TRINITY_DN524_c0_g1_i1.p1 TRINITY_DN524_c0_g1~~TRINITY_DN524_c0_g1_i1.p1  ORF type:complete len:466 (+),score=75.87 TRINITY_DN524_c0_g1_i1:91-1398(+)